MKEPWNDKKIKDAVKELVKATGAEQPTDALLKAVQEMKDQVKKVEVTLAGARQASSKQSKLQNLAWALDNVELNSFDYNNSNMVHPQSTADIVFPILWSFRRGKGYIIPDTALALSSKNDEPLDSKRNRFRDQLVVQIHQLTGSEPKLVKQKEGSWAIFHGDS